MFQVCVAKITTCNLRVRANCVFMRRCLTSLAIVFPLSLNRSREYPHGFLSAESNQLNTRPCCSSPGLLLLSWKCLLCCQLSSPTPDNTTTEVACTAIIGWSVSQCTVGVSFLDTLLWIELGGVTATERLIEHTNERTNGRTNGRTNERTDGRTNGRTNRSFKRTIERTNEHTTNKPPSVRPLTHSLTHALTPPNSETETITLDPHKTNFRFRVCPLLNLTIFYTVFDIFKSWGNFEKREAGSSRCFKVIMLVPVYKVLKYFCMNLSGRS